MMIMADGPDMQASLSDAIRYCVLVGILVLTFLVLRQRARRKAARAISGRVFRSPWAPLVEPENGDLWDDLQSTYVWQHDRWVPAKVDAQTGTWSRAA